MKNTQRGFTLVEILVAFVMLALVGGMILQLFQGGLRNVDAATHLTHASLLARSKLTELQASPGLIEGRSSGRFDETYRWTLETTPYLQENGSTLPENRLQLLETELVVSWEPAGQFRLVTLMLARSDLR